MISAMRGQKLAERVRAVGALRARAHTNAPARQASVTHITHSHVHLQITHTSNYSMTNYHIRQLYRTTIPNNYIEHQ